MKKFYLMACTALLAASLCACSFGRTNTGTTDTTAQTTTQPTIQEPETTPSMPPLKPNVPETTEGRGSTDDTTDSPNETLPEDAQRMRRRIMD